MTSLSIWLAAALILLVAGLLYRIAPGAGVLVVFVGVTVLVVIGDRLEEREREAEIESKRERLREAARRVPYNEGLLRVLATDVVTGEQFDPADIRTVEPDDFA